MMEFTTNEREMILIALRGELRTLQQMDADMVRRGIFAQDARQAIQLKAKSVYDLADKMERGLKTGA